LICPINIATAALGGLAGGLGFGVLVGLGFGLLFGLVLGAGFGVVVGLVFGLGLGLSFGAILGLFFALIFGLEGGLTGGAVEATAIPNQGIRRPVRSAILSGLVVGGIFGLGNELLYRLIYGLAVELVTSLLTGLEFGLIGVLAYGGYACLSHLALRFVLWHSGALPWQIARFLDYCTDCIFLRRVGGGYIFVHRLLMEYFAGLEPGTAE